MLTAIIIDDEQRGRVALREKLHEYCPGVIVTGEAANGADGLKLIREQKPALVFLDIEMPRMNGFEMLHQLPGKDFHLIFTTAYDQYAIKAIKYAAFDYLLKPVDIDELRSAIDRARAQSEKHTEKKLEVLQQHLQPKSPLGKIAIPSLEGLLFFNTSDIVHLEAQSNYTLIYFHNHPKLLASRTLKDFEELLPANMFFRTHHSHIINLSYIKRYIRGDGGQIEMQNGNYVMVSRRKKEEFLKTFGEWR
ncbi:MAG TPA: LytTR family DNA-binding domain-containing protein [Chitinophaga sp.]|uniref:LytR/AlgR family response regulator transcription factor n=1 Tax=Chitinophaga sp. TaxID=1869181 RepID=UPI002BB0FC2C|nr:LytTR family DNA-binding domain-containing protein [Chitinophaga sp.]HVI48228.1 LytTR family DNA-binding domain-containing protein [Chitinophaga sp.]